MDKQTLHQQIEILLETIQEQHNNTKTHSHTIPQIEVDILLSNMRKLYDFLLLLNKVKVHEEKKIEITTTSVVEQKKTEEGKQKQEKRREEVKEQVHVQIVETATALQPKEEEKVQQPQQETKNAKQGVPLLTDLFGEPEQPKVLTTVHDKVTKKQEEKSLADTLNKKPIKDLKSAIGINEKFLFINELFDGNLQEYNNSIDVLNQCQKHSEAIDYIKSNLSDKHKWEEENKYMLNFLDLIARRFL